MVMSLCMTWQYLSTCYENVHGMTLYGVVLFYMHNVDLVYYMIEVFLDLNEVVSSYYVDI